MALCNIEIIVDSNTVKLRVEKKDAEKFSNDVQNNKGNSWITLHGQGDEFAVFQPKDISSIVIRPNKEPHGLLGGFTVRDLSEVTGISYHTMVRQVNANKAELEMISDRRIAMNDENFKVLGLSTDQIRKLRKAEHERLSKSEK